VDVGLGKRMLFGAGFIGVDGEVFGDKLLDSWADDP